MSNPTVSDILEEWLKAHGYGGLVDTFCECGCRLGDLMPCEATCDQCEAAYAVPATEEQKREHMDETGQEIDTVLSLQPAQPPEQGEVE